ncbi:hypothetical protein [Streptomyces halobius]|nr:hypothetical protein [Streptomyces halobius]
MTRTALPPAGAGNVIARRYRTGLVLPRRTPEARCVIRGRAGA